MSKAAPCLPVKIYFSKPVIIEIICYHTRSNWPTKATGIARSFSFFLFCPGIKGFVLALSGYFSYCQLSSNSELAEWCQV